VGFGSRHAEKRAVTNSSSFGFGTVAQPPYHLPDASDGVAAVGNRIQSAYLPLIAFDPSSRAFGIGLTGDTPSEVLAREA